MEHLKPLQDKLCEQGPSYEYFPKVAKSVLILKSPHLMAKAKSFFAGVEIKITYEGRHHLGAAIGTDEFKKEYVKSKLRNGQKMLKNYHNLLKTSLKQHFQLIPQVAVPSAQRTVSDISEMFRPLEAIKSFQLWQISDLERRIFALPYRYEGLAMNNPFITN